MPAVRTFQTGRGFTLVELLATVAVIALLTGIVLALTKYATHHASVSKQRADLVALELALEQFKIENGSYPTSGVHRVGGPNLASNWKFSGVAYTNAYLLYDQLTAGPRVYVQFRPEQVRVYSNRTYIADAWGRPLNYYCYRTNLLVNTSSFDLWSYGPDGDSNNNPNHNLCRDDITNFR